MEISSPSSTHPHEADELFVANGFVRLIYRGWTGGRSTITEARIPTAVVFSAFLAVFNRALGCAARSLRWTARSSAPENDRKISVEI
jgi:hypothetical protein